MLSQDPDILIVVTPKWKNKHYSRAQQSKNSLCEPNSYCKHHKEKTHNRFRFLSRLFLSIVLFSSFFHSVNPPSKMSFRKDPPTNFCYFQWSAAFAQSFQPVPTWPPRRRNRHPNQLALESFAFSRGTVNFVFLVFVSLCLLIT